MSPHTPSRTSLASCVSGLLLIAVLCSVGCGSAEPAGSGPADASGPKLPPPGTREVQVLGAAANAEEGRPEPDEFLQQVRVRLTAGRPEELDRLLRLWPDVSLETLRRTTGDSAARPDRLALADRYDRLFGVSDPKAGWGFALTRLAADREGLGPLMVQRRQILDHIQAGQFEPAGRVAAEARSDPASAFAVAPAVQRAELLRLCGAAALLIDKPAEALACWQAALTAVVSGPSVDRMELALLVSEASRRLSRLDAAVEGWRTAVTVGAQSHAEVRDPGLWERAVAAQPPSTPWPAMPMPRVEPTPTAAADRGDVLLRVGQMRLARGNLAAALLTFSRAESETSAERLRGWARLYRAQTMVALRQVATALPMLEGLTQSADPILGRRAQAALGDVLCRVLGDRPRGLPILREAVAARDAGEWNGKSQAIANLGLYCLMEGREKEGLDWLHDAQRRFEGEARWADLADSVANEAEYLDSVSRSEEAQKCRQRAEELNRRLGRPDRPRPESPARSPGA